MKVQLIVVQGKPEGKAIPLVGPLFMIGRGETCHLRPNSEQVSREHAEFQVTAERVTLRDLGSRNGTLVNGKAITETATLKDRDLVQIGPLTFAVSIQDAPVAKAAPVKPSKPVSPDDVSQNEIDSWLVSDNAHATPERPSGVYEGDTITIAAFKANTPAKTKPEAPPVTPPPDDEEEEERERERELVGEAEEEEMTYDKLDDENEDSSEGPGGSNPEEFVDESNPFHVKKKAPEPKSAGPAKPSYKDTSDAASDILRKLMEKRKSSK